MKTKDMKMFNLKVVEEKNFGYLEEFEKIMNPQAIYNVAKAIGMCEQPYESFVLLTLDSGKTITGLFEVFRGTLSASMAHPRDIYQRALLMNAGSIVVMHNHPSGSLEPSNQDIDITKIIKDGGDMLGIELVDHMIITKNDYTSIRRHISINGDDW